MKKVVCINDDKQLTTAPKVKRGHTYTVIEERNEKREEKIINGVCFVYEPGTWYILLEMPKDMIYKSSKFIDLIEDQQDETEFNRNYKTEMV